MAFFVVFIVSVLVVFVSVNATNDNDDRLSVLEERVKQLQLLLSVNDTDDNVPPLASLEGFPKDCHDLYTNGIKTDGLYAVSPDGRYPFYVYCDMTEGGWTVIQRRFDGSVNFYRNWNDYVKGFGDLSGEHWLGLEKIHRLTKEGNRVEIEVEFNSTITLKGSGYKRWRGNHIKQTTQPFQVHSAASTYMMTSQEPYGYTGLEKFERFHGMKFSTYDNDNDASSSNNVCKVSGQGGGWWYKSKFKSPLYINGVFCLVDVPYGEENVLNNTKMRVKPMGID